MCDNIQVLPGSVCVCAWSGRLMLLQKYQESKLTALLYCAKIVGRKSFQDKTCSPPDPSRLLVFQQRQKCSTRKLWMKTQAISSLHHCKAASAPKRNMQFQNDLPNASFTTMQNLRKWHEERMYSMHPGKYKRAELNLHLVNLTALGVPERCVVGGSPQGIQFHFFWELFNDSYCLLKACLGSPILKQSMFRHSYPLKKALTKG